MKYYSESFLTAILPLVFKKDLQEKIVSIAIKFLIKALITQELLKKIPVDSLNLFLNERLLEILLLDEHDISLHQENPLEFIRQGEDNIFRFDQVYDPKQDAKDMLITLCTRNNESLDKSFLFKYFDFCCKIL